MVLAQDFAYALVGNYKGNFVAIKCKQKHMANLSLHHFQHVVLFTKTATKVTAVTLVVPYQCYGYHNEEAKLVHAIYFILHDI